MNKVWIVINRWDDGESLNEDIVGVFASQASADRCAVSCALERRDGAIKEAYDVSEYEVKP